jgi:hypothetical protein
VEQIVRNLLNNAAKYSPLGSRVVVSAHRVDGSVVVRVTDDGPGIPPASVERIFELFYRDPTSSRLVAGSGIGLFVCASLVEAMGGRIWASRPSAGGTEVGFSLRVLEADADEPSLPVPSALPAVLPVRPPPPKRDRDQGSRRARPRPSGSDRQQPDEPDEGTGEDEAPAADPQGEKDQGDDGFGEREDVADRAATTAMSATAATLTPSRKARARSDAAAARQGPDRGSEGDGVELVRIDAEVAYGLGGLRRRQCAAACQGDHRGRRDMRRVDLE